MTEDTGSRALLSDPTRRSDGLIARVSVTTQPDPARTAVTPEQRAAWRKDHVPVPRRSVPVGTPEHLRDVCSCGYRAYPCIELRLLDALAASEARLAEVERERDALRRFVAYVAYEQGPVLGDAAIGTARSLLEYPAAMDAAARSAGEGAE